MDLFDIFKAAAEGWTIHASPIHGKGVFATRPFRTGEVIEKILERQPGDEEILYKRTHFGLYVNHQDRSNSKFHKQGNDWYLMAVEDIGVDEEIVTNYQHYYRDMYKEQESTGKVVTVD